MPPKRRRTSESSSTENGGQQENATTTEPQPHDEFWFSDGSIVLATDIHLYRVHKSVLARYSKVFSDMFEIPTGDANTESWEGVPIVRMVGDSDGDVCVLLKALYGVNLHVALRDSSIPEVTSLLSMSSKYDCQAIRADVMQRLEFLFPNKLEKYEEAKLFWGQFSPGQVFELLLVAHRCEALLILPILYYLCARFPPETIIDHIDALPKDYTKALLVGRDELREMSNRITQRSLLSSQIEGEFERGCGRIACTERFRGLVSERDLVLVFDIPDCDILKGIHRICNDCALRHKVFVRDIKELNWDELPVRFLERSWEDLGRT
ncbi:hypothetical protein SCHPADRAFT_945468 [Schizopora paradoxa]|uniref:BTB domain-containing protein n=1 Tax=Schizopora paradoxa TaxID=27342 RepID=A0A0H2R5U3_9AGAM|nr:hypothetical protein SCHPADRAFT_945468 [Schizopora paradoxa]